MLVKVGVCKDAFEGEVVKGMLAANGIDCHLQNETISQIYGGIQAFAINVMVKEEDAEKAKELLDARTEAEHKGDEKPQWIQKSTMQMLLESLLFTFFAIVICLLGNWISNSLQSVSFYVIFACVAFGGWFLAQLFFFRKIQKKKE
jgi:hypothetical protein